ncbi:MAG: thioredoxin family protein [Armatimonadetes bacterium]|nr:thioredoxin family protein [Armatimonadota bacterium]
MKRRYIPIWVIVAVIASALYAAPPAKPKSKPDTCPAKSVAGPKLPVFLELGATWCGACRSMVPVINDLKKEYKGKVNFQYIDIDKDKTAVKKYKIDAIPVLVFFDKNGKQVYKHVGALSKDEIRKQFAKMGIKK